MIPNLVGALLGCVQLALIGVFPMKVKARWGGQTTGCVGWGGSGVTRATCACVEEVWGIEQSQVVGLKGGMW